MSPTFVLRYFLPQETATTINYQRGFPVDRGIYMSRFPMLRTSLSTRSYLINIILEPTTSDLDELPGYVSSYCFMNDAGARWTSTLPLSFFTVMCEPTVPVTGH